MSNKTNKDMIINAINLLCEWLDCEPSQITYESRSTNSLESESRVDAKIFIHDLTYLIEYKDSGDVSSVVNGINLLNSIEIDNQDCIKTLVVPFMHEFGRRRCEEAKTSWFDLSGNANITGPGIRIIIEDQPNKFKKPGRSANVFAPKSSRVARFLLFNQNDYFSQREISNQTDLGEGYVSKIVSSLESKNLIRRDDEGYLTIKDPELILEAWLEKYSFSKHDQIRGYVPARSGQLLMKNIGSYFNNRNIDYAITGLGAAWMYNKFASFRTVTVYINRSFDNDLLSDLDFQVADSGSNIIIAKPNDESVFWKLNNIEEIKCVHPIQAYLDLKDQPERAKEAMSELRKNIFSIT